MLEAASGSVSRVSERWSLEFLTSFFNWEQPHRLHPITPSSALGHFQLYPHALPPLWYHLPGFPRTGFLIPTLRSWYWFFGAPTRNGGSLVITRVERSQSIFKCYSLSYGFILTIPGMNCSNSHLYFGWNSQTKPVLLTFSQSNYKYVLQWVNKAIKLILVQ